MSVTITNFDNSVEFKIDEKVRLVDKTNMYIHWGDESDYISVHNTIDPVNSINIIDIDYKEVVPAIASAQDLYDLLEGYKNEPVSITVDTSGLATEATLEAIRVLTVSLDGKDYSTETTLAALKLVADSIKTNTDALDVDLSTRASETTLAATNVLLTALNAKDFSTETTLLAVEGVLNLLEAKDFATETTLAAIKAQTDLLSFTGAKLRTTGEDAAGGGASTFGDTGGYLALTPDGTNQQVLAADTDFKEVILYHENKKTAWIKLGGGSAVVGEGFPIKKKQPWILDKCRDEIRIIFESGFDSNDLQISTVTL